MMRGDVYSRFLVYAGIGLLACAIASAQYASDFESPLYTGSPEGTGLAGQDLFYIPDASTPSTDCFVYTYADNVLGIPPNPNGGAQFAAATGLGDGSYARGQRTEDGTWGDMTGVWTLAFDAAVAFVGVAPTTQNVGSMSTQPLDDPLAPTEAGFIALAQWTDETTATNWEANYLAYDPNGDYIYGAEAADPAFHNLPTFHWYRWSTTIDFDTNLIVSISITDLATGDTATEEPVEWFLGGGEVGGLPGPTGFRLFAGSGTVYGNTLAVDNVSITPEAECPGDVDGDGDTDLADLAGLLASYLLCSGDPGFEPAADFDGSGCVDLSDLAFLLADYLCGT